MPPDLPRRLAACLIVFVALGSVRTDFDIHAGIPGQEVFGTRLWLFAGYFTILTNLLIAGAMATEAMKRQVPGWLMAGLLVSILVTGLVYHTLLSRNLPPLSAHWWADMGLHTAVPLMVLAWWVVWAAKDITQADLPRMLLWPAAYTAYALIRGGLTEVWPYPFLDAGTLGWLRVVVNMLGIGAVFAAIGLAVIALAARLRE